MTSRRSANAGSAARRSASVWAWSARARGAAGVLMTHRVVVWGHRQRRPAGDPGGRRRTATSSWSARSSRTRRRSGRDAGELAGIEPLGRARDRRRRRSRSAATSTRSSTPRPPTPDPRHALAGSRRVPRAPARTSCRPSFYPLLHPASAPPRAARRGRAGVCAKVAVVGVRLGHRSRVGARHPPRAGERGRRRHQRDPDPGAVQLRALRPAGRRARGDRVRRADGRAAADAPRLLAATWCGRRCCGSSPTCSTSSSKRSPRTSSGDRSSARSRSPAWARSSAARKARSASRCAGIVDGRPLLVVEHVTRIDDECAPDWPPVRVTRRRAQGDPHRAPEPRRCRCTARSRASRAPPVAGTRPRRTAS